MKQLEIGNDWIQCYSGKRFFYNNLSADNIAIEDIAQSLSLQCRFNGHIICFYSVAEHCILIADKLYDNFADPLLALTGLLHDAAEAYITDIPRPLKALMPKEFKEMEVKIEQLIADKYKITYPFPASIKEYDNRILVDEKRFMKDALEWEIDSLQPLGVKFKNYQAIDASFAYLDRFKKYRKLAKL